MSLCEHTEMDPDCPPCWDSPPGTLTRARDDLARSMYSPGATYAEMSDALGGVDRTHLSSVIHGRTWKHLPGIPKRKRRRAS